VIDLFYPPAVEPQPTRIVTMEDRESEAARLAREQLERETAEALLATKRAALKPPQGRKRDRHRQKTPEQIAAVREQRRIWQQMSRQRPEVRARRNENNRRYRERMKAREQGREA
jgi:hypothetical protein